MEIQAEAQRKPRAMRLSVTTVRLPMNISRRDLLAALTLAPAASLLAGRQGPAGAPAPSGVTPEGGQAKFSSDVNVVNLFATVRTKQGKIVNNLTKDDFLLDEEEKPQTIQYFAQESGLPLHLGLMVDTSGSQRTVLNDERTASYRFFDQILRQDRDLAFVLHFDFQVELLQDFTASRQLLEKALDELEIGQQRVQQGQGQGGGYPGGGGGQGGRGRGGGGTNLYDAILLASDELMSKQKGRKALILLTDGVDTGSKTTLYQAVESAQKADTLVYSVLFSDSNAYQSAPMSMPRMGGRRGGMGRMPAPRGGYDSGNGRAVLEQIARETGGRFFEASFLHPINKIYADIEEELRNQYSIGYTPDPLSHGGVYRHIHLTTKQKNTTVATREGYYAT